MVDRERVTALLRRLDVEVAYLRARARYAEVDDDLVVAQLDGVGDLADFVAGAAAWLTS